MEQVKCWVCKEEFWAKRENKKQLVFYCQSPTCQQEKRKSKKRPYVCGQCGSRKKQSEMHFNRGALKPSKYCKICEHKKKRAREKALYRKNFAKANKTVLKMCKICGNYFTTACSSYVNCSSCRKKKLTFLKTHQPDLDSQEPQVKVRRCKTCGYPYLSTEWHDCASSPDYYCRQVARTP